MTKRMLIDATHAEETRVVVLDGSRLEDFDVETSTKRQLKGNIYLAKVVRVEPSLQAAFVEYGGNRHGFLAFGEIHPDYYQIPVADRQRLIEMEAEEARREEEEEDRAAEAAAGEAVAAPAPAESETDATAMPEFTEQEAAVEAPQEEVAVQPAETVTEVVADSVDMSGPDPEPAEPHEGVPEREAIDPLVDVLEAEPTVEAFTDTGEEPEPPPETVGGEPDGAEDARERRIPSRFLRN